MTPVAGKSLVILNQAANYLTVGFANAFNQRFDSVALVSGSVHVQGEELDSDIEVRYINRWHERPAGRKAMSYLLALVRMWWLLMTRYRRHDVLFVSVPPMGYLLNLILPHRFSMVVWDIYPDTFQITGMRESHLVYRVWARLNRWSFRRAYRLFTISETMGEALSRYVDREKLIICPIWSVFRPADRISKKCNAFLNEQDLKDRFIVQYSGNIGLTHNVELLIDLAERLKTDQRILFQIIGRGPREPYIRRRVLESGLQNVQMLPFQSDRMFIHSLSAADLGVVILDERVSRGSVPSKAYNVMSLGIPSLYVAGADSQLALDADRFGHARCYQSKEMGAITAFVQLLASDRSLQRTMGQAAEQASGFFTRANADRFVDSYLESEVGSK